MSFQDFYDDSSEEPTHHDKEDLRRQLPITFVLDTNTVEMSGGSSPSAFCPFHNDTTTPNLSIFGEYLDRYHCFACGAKGDVFDIISHFYQTVSFPEILTKAAELIEGVKSWRGPKTGFKKAEINKTHVLEVVNASEHGDLSTLEEYINYRGWNFSAKWLRAHYRVGSWEGLLIIPYFTRAGQLVAYKWRASDTKPISVTGADFSEILYGEWGGFQEEDDNRPVVLCEGESDVWNTAYQLGADYLVLGLATGANSPVNVSGLKDRTIYLAFDGDRAGREASYRWAVTLKESGVDDILVVHLPEGSDLSECSNIKTLLKSADTFIPPPDSIGADKDGYFSITEKGKKVQLSNWKFEPHLRVDGLSHPMWEGVILPGNVRASITSDDLSSAKNLHRWASAHRRSWMGTDNRARTLQAWLESYNPFIPLVRKSSVVGLVEQSIVWPGGVIGDQSLTYDPISGTIDLGDKFSISPNGSMVPEMFTVVKSLHRADVIDPILAWLAAAPLRSLYHQFPVLAIQGSAGSGKSTLMEWIVPWFLGSKIETTLTVSTRYATMALLSSTNAFPLFVDEYRREARKDTLSAFKQILRDSFNGKTTFQGGGERHWSKLVENQIAAPVIVVGEELFSEVSHVERMISIDFPTDGRSPAALQKVRAWRDSSWSYEYLKFVQQEIAENYVDRLTITPEGSEDLPYRVRENLGTIRAGWGMLERFMRTQGVEIGEPDFSLVEKSIRAGLSRDPVKSAIIFCSTSLRGSDFVFVRDGILHVETVEFTEVVEKMKIFTLPGGPEAIGRILEDKYGAVKQFVKVGSLSKPCYTFPAALIMGETILEEKSA